MEYRIKSIDMYENYMNEIKNKCIEKGFSENEAIYVINKIRNTMRKATKGWNAYNFKISINEKDSQYLNEEIKLKSGKIVKFGFSLD